MYLKTLLISSILLISSAEKITFKNVTVTCHRLEEKKITVFISAAKTLRENLPDSRCYALIFEQKGTIPVVYKDSLANLQIMYSLELANQGIEEIEAGAFGNWSRMEFLSLERNKLRGIQEGVFTLPNLKTLIMSSNIMENIPPNAFDGLPNLNYFDLRDNKLKKFYSQWFENKVLDFVDLSYNLIEEIPEGSLKNLRWPIEESDSTVMYGGIKLNHNRIKKISNSIFGNGTIKLKYLDLSNNEITSWDENLFDNVSLHNFMVVDNKVKCLDGNLTRLLAPKNSYILRNPWNSDCATRIVKWYNDENPNEVRVVALFPRR